MMRQINDGVIAISETVREIQLPKNDDREITFFLCGGARTDQALLRKQLGNGIARTRSKFNYSVYYPEHIFVDLVHGHRKVDLLRLENLLAESVSAVVILLHSTGTFVELGAFANHFQLRNKLVVVADPKYNRSRSFVNLGPINFLKNNTSSHVIYEKLELANLANLKKSVSAAIRNVAKQSTVSFTLRNPLLASRLLEGLIFVFGPIPLNILLQIFTCLDEASTYQDLEISMDAALTTLVRSGTIIRIGDELDFSQAFQPKSQTKDMSNSLSPEDLIQELWNENRQNRLELLRIRALKYIYSSKKGGWAARL